MENNVEFFIAHVGINEENADTAQALADRLCAIFGWAAKPGTSSVFAGKGIEIMKGPYLGKNGHIAVGTNDIMAAMELLKTRGVEFDDDTKKLASDGSLKAIYMKGDFGGFALHLVQV
ncbi:MAG: VOC family protein [Oscillospiraceae bacterium]